MRFGTAITRKLMFIITQLKVFDRYDVKVSGHRNYFMHQGDLTFSIKILNAW